jgi:hypothetical protein
MVAQEDREFLARVAQLNRALAASALPLMNDDLDAAAGHRLGVELLAVGEEYLRRAHAALDLECGPDVIDGHVLYTTDRARNGVAEKC